MLNRRQDRWAQFLTRFNFKITYRLRKQQGKADALSRRSYLTPHPRELTFDNQKQVILGPTRLQAMEVLGMPLDSHVIGTICEDFKTDAFAQAILAQVDPSRSSGSLSQQPGTDNRQFKCHDGLLFFNKLLYVPNGSCRLQVVQNCHGTRRFKGGIVL